MALREQVSALMRAVGAAVVAPRFRMLAADEIAEKSPGEIVTSADYESERRLHDGLAALLPAARIVGEEAAARDPCLLDAIGSGLVWLIDPLDGTANFAAGREPFGMMIALVDDGVPIAGWLLDPLSGRLCHAERGKGATCDGVPVRVRAPQRTPLVAALGTHFLSPERRARVHACAETGLDVVPVPRCAAESYPRLVFGNDDIALFQRILPWDHAAGILFLCEAGGHATHWDRRPYRVGGDGQGVLVAASEPLWQAAADLLLGPEAGLVETEVCVS
ncbi:MAG: inositol monophosphatase family protein [Novosphingobium sp.]|nr:inositol monophosphatase [Novosphingobium sp.]